MVYERPFPLLFFPFPFLFSLSLPFAFENMYDCVYIFLFFLFMLATVHDLKRCSSLTLQSLGIYGASPFLLPNYGVSELPQGFSRQVVSMAM